MIRMSRHGRKGIVYRQRYNVYIDLFITLERGAIAPFADAKMERVALPDYLLETRLTIAPIPFQTRVGKAKMTFKKHFLY
jgi:hypothetical protein